MRLPRMLGEEDDVRAEIDHLLTQLETELEVRARPLEDVSTYVNTLLPFEEHPDEVAPERSIWTFTSDSLHGSRKRRLCSVHDAQIRLTQLLQINGDRDPSGSSLPDEYRARINRLYELIFYSHSMQECRQRVQQILDPSYTNTSPVILVERLFRPRNPDQKLSPYQRCITTALSRITLKRYRKYQGSIYEAVYSGGHYTYAWRRLMPIKDWVWREIAIASQTSFEVWDDATQTKGNIDGLITYLLECQDAEFPTLKKHRRLLSFKNGVYVTAYREAGSDEWKDKFCKYGTDDMKFIASLTGDNAVAAVYHDADFPDLDDQDEGALIANPDEMIPSLARIMRHQEWGLAVEWWLRAFIGRMLHNIGGPLAIERWQVIAMLLGLGNTGKSTIIQDVVASFYDPEDVEFVGNNMEKQFGWSNLRGKYVWVAPEIKADFAEHCDQTQWQQIVCAERFQAAKKHKDALQMLPEDIPTGMMGGNENIDFHDNGSSVSRRRVDWYFGNPVTVVDPTLPDKLRAEIPATICITNKTYLRAVNQTSRGNGRIWNYLPRYFQDLQAENSEATNALVHFLNHGPLTFGEHLYMLFRDFTRMYKSHCRDNDLSAKCFKRDYWAGPFKTKKLSVSKLEHPKPDFPAEMGKGPWLFGCQALVQITPQVSGASSS